MDETLESYAGGPGHTVIEGLGGMSALERVREKERKKGNKYLIDASCIPGRAH